MNRHGPIPDATRCPPRVSTRVPASLATFLVLAFGMACLVIAPARASDDALGLEAHRGKIVYVDFWASWCTPCRAAFPWMNALQAEIGTDDLVVIAVNTGDTREAAERFLEEVPADFPIVFDEDGGIARAYEVQGMPTAFVHDRDGALVDTHTGFTEASSEARAEAIRRLVAETR